MNKDAELRRTFIAQVRVQGPENGVARVKLALDGSAHSRAAFTVLKAANERWGGLTINPERADILFSKAEAG